MSDVIVSKRAYEAQEAHSQEDCRINDAAHSHPDYDCGHYVNSGPGVGPQKAVNMKPFCGPDPTAPSSINGDQDPTHGPGVK